MPKEGSIEFQGVVLELLPNAMFKVKLKNDNEILPDDKLIKYLNEQSFKVRNASL